jgi:hypothetical protein
VKAAYRRLVAEAHPDHGGEAAEFISIRAAYEILSAFLGRSAPEDDIAIPEELRAVIAGIVRDFQVHQQWLDEETARKLGVFETRMADYIRTASRSELRRFGDVFRVSWNATINALFSEYNTKCDEILRSYESWYTASTQAVFADLYRRELLHFVARRRFWEIFVVVVALAGALTAVIGWTGPVARWVSVGLLVAGAGLSYVGYWWWCWRQRKQRERVEPLSVAPFVLQEGARFRTEAAMRRGRRTTAAMGVAGLFIGNAAAGGFAVPLVGALAGMVFGGVFDRLLNPTGRVRESMQHDLRAFMTAAKPQVAAYVFQAHEDLLSDVRGQILANYQERVKKTVKLLTAGSAVAPKRSRRLGRRSSPVA